MAKFDGAKLAELQRRDMEALSRDPRFLRFLFTVLDDAGIWRPAHDAEVRHLERFEGRRSLGLTILERVANLSARPEILQEVLQAATTARKEYEDERSTEHDDRDPEPRARAQRKPAGGDAERGSEGRYLDYT